MNNKNISEWKMSKKGVQPKQKKAKIVVVSTESVSKSSETRVFDTRYPTSEELKYYNDRLMFSQLQRRLNDRTFENMIYDAGVRRDAAFIDGGMFCTDILRCIMIHTNIRIVYELAIKSVTVQRFLLEDETFWKLRFLAEFPEVAAIFGPGLPTHWETRGDLLFGRNHVRNGVSRFQNQPWRRYYNIMQVIISGVKMLLPHNAALMLLRPGLHFNINKIPNEDKYTCETSVHATGETIGLVNVDFDTFWRNFGVRGNYLQKFGTSKVREGEAKFFEKWGPERYEAMGAFLKLCDFGNFSDRFVPLSMHYASIKSKEQACGFLHALFTRGYIATKFGRGVVVG